LPEEHKEHEEEVEEHGAFVKLGLMDQGMQVIYIYISHDGWMVCLLESCFTAVSLWAKKAC
jgi:hypothetical protein